MGRSSSVGLAYINHSKNLFCVDLKQNSYMNFWNHTALFLYLAISHPSYESYRKNSRFYSNISESSITKLFSNECQKPNLFWCFC